MPVIAPTPPCGATSWTSAQNNTDYPIKIESYLDKNHKLHVTIYGTDTTGIHGEPYHVVISTVPYKNTYQPKDSIPVGTEPQRDPNYSRYNGYTVDLYQKLVDKNGKTISTTLLYRNTYKASDAVYYYNPADAARWGWTSTGLKTLRRSPPPHRQSPSPSPCAQSDARRHPSPVPTPHLCFPEPSPTVPQPGVPCRHIPLLWRPPPPESGVSPGMEPVETPAVTPETGSTPAAVPQRRPPPDPKTQWRPNGPPLRSVDNPPTKGFGEDSVKGNRQGFPFTLDQTNFWNFSKVSNWQPVEKTFSTGGGPKGLRSYREKEGSLCFKAFPAPPWTSCGASGSTTKRAGSRPQGGVPDHLSAAHEGAGRRGVRAFTDRHPDLDLICKVSRIYRDARRLFGPRPYNAICG